MSGCCKNEIVIERDACVCEVFVCGGDEGGFVVVYDSMYTQKSSLGLFHTHRTQKSTTKNDFAAMNKLAETYGDKLSILAFPCNQFGHRPTRITRRF